MRSARRPTRRGAGAADAAAAATNEGRPAAATAAAATAAAVTSAARRGATASAAATATAAGAAGATARRPGRRARPRRPRLPGERRRPPRDAGGVADAGGRLAPRSDLGRGGERGGRDAPPRPVPGPRGEKGGEKEEKEAKEAKEKAPEPASAAPASATMSDEAYETERKRVLEYFFDDKDADEAMAAISRWGGFEPRVPEFVQHLVVSGFERRTMDWDAAATLFRRLPAGAGGPASAAGIVAGVKLVLDDLEDQKCDLPKADEHLATVLAGAVADGSVAFAALAAAAAEAGPEGDAGYLREEGGAMAVLCKILAAVARAWGAPRAERALADSGVDLAAFIGTMDKEDGVTLNALLEKYGVAALPAGASLAPTRAKLAELVAGGPGASGDALAAWIESDASAEARVSAEFVGEVAAWALAAVPADADASAPIAALAPAFAALRAACKGPGRRKAQRRRRSRRQGGARGGGAERRAAAVRGAGVPGGAARAHLPRSARRGRAGRDRHESLARRRGKRDRAGEDRGQGEGAVRDDGAPAGIRERRRGRRGAARVIVASETLRSP